MYVAIEARPDQYLQTGQSGALAEFVYGMNFLWEFEGYKLGHPCKGYKYLK